MTYFKFGTIMRALSRGVGGTVINHNILSWRVVRCSPLILTPGTHLLDGWSECGQFKTRVNYILVLFFHWLFPHAMRGHWCGSSLFTLFCPGRPAPLHLPSSSWPPPSSTCRHPPCPLPNVIVSPQYVSEPSESRFSQLPTHPPPHLHCFPHNFVRHPVQSRFSYAEPERPHFG